MTKNCIERKYFLSDCACASNLCDLLPLALKTFSTFAFTWYNSNRHTSEPIYTCTLIHHQYHSYDLKCATE